MAFTDIYEEISFLFPDYSVAFWYLQFNGSGNRSLENKVGEGVRNPSAQ